MKDLEDELIEMVRIFDLFDIPYNKQKYLICNGILFEFFPNERVKLDCFRFAKFLEMQKRIREDFDANQMLSDIAHGHDYPYEPLVKVFLANEEYEKEEKAKQKSIGEKK